jgi:hypothetical protein
VVVEVLGACAVVSDVVGAASGQLTDKVVEVFVVGIAAGLGSQDRDAGVGGALQSG